MAGFCTAADCYLPAHGASRWCLGHLRREARGRVVEGPLRERGTAWSSLVEAAIGFVECSDCDREYRTPGARATSCSSGLRRGNSWSRRGLGSTEIPTRVATSAHEKGNTVIESENLQNLRQKASDLYAENNVIIAQADAERRPLSDGERQDIEKNNAVFDSLVCKIEAGERGERLNAPQARPITDLPARGGRGAFNSLGGFLGAVHNAGVTGRVDPRLVQSAVTTYGNESTGPDGGFAVPAQYASAIWDIVGGEKSILGQLNPIPCTSNMLTVPVDETTPHGTSGVTADWVAEGGTITATKPLIQLRNVQVHKAAALVHLSDELIEDSPQMSQHVAKLLGRKIGSVVEAALVAGDGVGKPLGVLSGPGAVTVDNETTTLSATDLLNMLSRLPTTSVSNAFWLMHSSVYPHVAALTLGQVPVVQRDLTAPIYGKILGLPIFVSEYCQSWNAAAGDLNLVAPDGIITVVKSSGVQMASTIGFAFDAGLQSFRATVRIGQVPVLSAPIARKNGTLTLSHVVKLDVRS